MKPTCEEWLERVSRSVDGELPAEEASKLDAHLAACPSCRAAAAEFREADRRVAVAVQGRAEQARLDRVESAVLAQARREKRSDGGRAWTVWRSVTVLAAAASIAVAVYLSSPTRPTGPTGPTEVPPIAEAGDFASAITVGNVASLAATETAATADLSAVADEAATVFQIALNAEDSRKFSQCQIAADGLVPRAQALKQAGWSHPDVARDVDNMAQNLVWIQNATIGSDESVQKVQYLVSSNGALQSCENLKSGVTGVSSGASASAAIQKVIDAAGAPDEKLFWSTNDRLRAGDAEAAIAVCETIVRDYPDGKWADDALYRKGQICEYVLHDYARALEAYERLAGTYRDSNLKWGGELNQARIQTQKMRSYDEGANGYRNVQQEVQGQAAKGAGANRLVELAASRLRFIESNNDRDGEPLGLYLDAEVALEQGDRTRAIAILDDLLTRHPSSAVRDEALYLKGEILRLEGKLDDALNAWGTVSNERPDSPAAKCADQSRRLVEENLRQSSQEGK